VPGLPNQLAAGAAPCPQLLGLQAQARRISRGQTGAGNRVRDTPAAVRDRAAERNAAGSGGGWSTWINRPRLTCWDWQHSAAVTAYVNDCPALGTVLAAIGGIALILTFAKWLPLLHKLPLVGAISPPEVRFHLEAPRNGMTFPMNPSAEARVLLGAVIPEGRRHEITRVLVNAYVVGATDIRRTTQDGRPYPDGGHRMGGPDGPYWSIHPLTIPIGAMLMFFKVTIPRPGEYKVVLRLQSPDFYEKSDQVYEDKLIARG
jgi:hypothetical protein